MTNVYQIIIQWNALNKHDENLMKYFLCCMFEAFFVFSAEKLYSFEVRLLQYFFCGAWIFEINNEMRSLA